MRIVVVGSSNTDMIIKVPRIPKPGETILGGVFSTAPGGKGANQAVAAARAGGEVAFIAKIGRDTLGDESLRRFIEDRIDTTFVYRDDSAPSGVAQILVAENGENSIAVASGSNSNLRPQDIRNAKEWIISADIVLVQLEIPLDTVIEVVTLSHRLNKTIILNPAPAIDAPDNLLSHISFLTPNQTETELLTGIAVVDRDSAREAGRQLCSKGVATVTITMGAEGVFVFSRQEELFRRAYKVKAVDTTAAGDVFNGALAVALSEGKGIGDAVSFANAAAALSVGKLGAQSSIPSRTEIDNFLSDRLAG